MPDVRADLSQPASLVPQQWQWLPSPQPEVERVMLDRQGDEVAVATSIVRYAEDSAFPAHEHALGEEFIVLQGEFGDEHGRYGAGSYLRNPAGTAHSPFSEPGCIIWVKLRQFDLADQRPCVLQLDSPMPARGIERRELHRYGNEVVQEIVAAEGETVELTPVDEVQELLVLEGEVVADGARYPSWSWLRLPAGQGAGLRTQTRVRLFHKTRPVYRR